MAMLRDTAGGRGPGSAVCAESSCTSTPVVWAESFAAAGVDPAEAAPAGGPETSAQFDWVRQ
jgi:hypothetical protein